MDNVASEPMAFSRDFVEWMPESRAVQAAERHRHDL